MGLLRSVVDRTDEWCLRGNLIHADLCNVTHFTVRLRSGDACPESAAFHVANLSTVAVRKGFED